ncbi:WD40 repeat-like protein [Xylaria sp. FL1777]|nr:WD40 repeat-like protein [Xylaria sp. FL1777]
MATRGHISTAPPNAAIDIIDLTGDNADVRPWKRQRIGVPSPELRARDEQRRRHELAAALGKCLEEQVFPHIERATAALSPDIYDVDKLGAKVTRLIVDKDFQRYFSQGRGRLAPTVESIIAAGVHRLVTQLAALPDYRRAASNSIPVPSTATATATATAVTTVTAAIVAAATAAAAATLPTTITPIPVPVPAILPSIEKESDNTLDDSGDGDNAENSDSNYAGDIAGDIDIDIVDAGEGDEASDVDNAGDDDFGSYNPRSSLDELPHELEEPEVSASSQPAIRTLPTHYRPQKGPVSPQQLRTRAKASQWQSGKAYNSVSEATHPRSFGLPLRPYLPAVERQQIISTVEKTFLPLTLGRSPVSQVFHVDLNDAEIHYLQRLARQLYGKPFINSQRSILRDLRNILKKVPGIGTSLAEIHAKGYIGYDSPPPSLRKRSSNDITNFLKDLFEKKLNSIPKSLFIEKGNSVAQSEASRANKMPALLLSREITGNRLGAGRTYQNFITTVKSNREDYLEPQVEWTNCAGDIMTVSWLSNTDFVCGTTTHSDSHNQQYNKPGNLLLGSAVTNTLRAYPDHRIIRPIVSSGNNALHSMVASQDPWLFTSVVSSDYDPTCELAFTSSFDKTVKIWKPGNGSILAIGSWEHGGRVNFVVASKNGTATVATAADVPTEAVRVYHIDFSNISGSPYDSYSCTRVHDEDYVPSEKWAYYPAAIRWGLAPSVSHLLLIGYSPRSPTGEDDQIPEDKRNSGELCLWDTSTRTQVKVNSAKTQNVFEVAWHPSRASFAAATSASQSLEKTDQTVRTQIRLFEMNNETGQYSAIKTLDCAAVDINELSIMPNSLNYSYVAASCTDGKVYIWDTAASDLPMCVLEHGDPVEELIGLREEEDVGVKFTAWATTSDRLYTGSSDGVVKVWNIRHGRGVLVKDLIEVAAPITYGAFSPDNTRLVIGDASGRVYLLALEDPENEDPPPNPAGFSAGFLNVQTSSGSQRSIRRPRPFIPHHEVPPLHELMEGQESAREYLRSAQLVLCPDPTVGVVQGINYAETGLFRAEAHVNEDPNEPLLIAFQNNQQECQPDLLRTELPRQLEQSNDGLVNGWHENHIQPSRIEESFDGGNHQDIFDHATWLELKKDKAELDDRLIELHYETSIADSDDDNEDDTEG